jgi:GTPase
MTDTRAGFVALIGEPNAGKSTLLNKMAGQAQIVFVDTPGLFRPRRRLDRAMVKAAWGGAADADIIVLLIEAHRGMTDGVKAIIERMRDQIPKGQPVALAINKIDRVKAEVLLALAQKMNEAFPFAETFMISAEKGYGVDKLKDWLAGQLPVGAWFYPEDQIADSPMRQIAAEMTREKLTLRLHEELPYQLTVETENWEDKSDGTTRIDQIVYVARDGHKGIVLGNGGETIKSVGQAARADIAEFLGRTVHLFLQVKVRANWLEEKERYTEMGLDFKDGD